MSLDFYGVETQPFGSSPDPKYLYLSRSHREALASLYYALETGRGFAALLAEPGMGKTTLLFHLLERLRNHARTVFIFQRQASEYELLRYLVRDLEIGPPSGDLGGLYAQLNGFLHRQAGAGRSVVVAVDEAQNLDPNVLEVLRMLSNFETPGQKLLQILLSGQPQLGRMLLSPELSQLRQRIGIVARLVPFTRDEVRGYIEHRMHVAGHRGTLPFRRAALHLIADRSAGIPRNINTLCFNALNLGYALGRPRIGTAIVKEVLNDLRLDGFSSPGQAAKAMLTPAPDPMAEWWTAAKYLLTALVALVIVLSLALKFGPGRRAAAGGGSLNATQVEEQSAPVPFRIVTVMHGDTLNTLCQRELGVSGPRVIAQVLRFNPHLGSPDLIHAGDLISLPLSLELGARGRPGTAKTYRGDNKE